MKIGDITVGEEYAVHDEPTSRSGYILPRQAKALEIVTVEEKRYNRYSVGTSTTKRRKVKVELLGEPTYESSSYRYTLASAPKGAIREIEARFILSPWDHVRDDVKKRLDEKAEQEAAEKALEDRVMRLVKAGATQKERRREFYVMPDVRRYGGKLTPELRVEGEAVDWLLTLAEAGLAARGS